MLSVIINIWFSFLMTIGSPIFFQSSSSNLNYRLQLAFIEKFSSFITWSAPVENNFIILVYGDSPFGDSIDEFYKNVQMQEKAVKIIKSSTLIGIVDPNIIYVCESKKAEIEKIVKWALPKNVLTIANTKDAAKKGIMINFYEEKGKIRFEINHDQFQENNFKINSKLLKLAKIVG